MNSVRLTPKNLSFLAKFQIPLSCLCPTWPRRFVGVNFLAKEPHWLSPWGTGLWCHWLSTGLGTRKSFFVPNSATNLIKSLPVSVWLHLKLVAIAPASPLRGCLQPSQKPPLLGCFQALHEWLQTLPKAWVAWGPNQLCQPPCVGLQISWGLWRQPHSQSVGGAVQEPVPGLHKHADICMGVSSRYLDL